VDLSSRHHKHSLDHRTMSRHLLSSLSQGIQPLAPSRRALFPATTSRISIVARSAEESSVQDLLARDRKTRPVQPELAEFDVSSSSSKSTQPQQQTVKSRSRRRELASQERKDGYDPLLMPKSQQQQPVDELQSPALHNTAHYISTALVWHHSQAQEVQGGYGPGA
jgi:hypothetical protein